MSLLIILGLLLPAVLVGALLTYFASDRLSPWTRISAGAAAGPALLAWIGFLASLAAGLRGSTIIAVGLLFLILLLALIRALPRPRILADLRSARATLDRSSIIYYLGWAALLGLLFSRVIRFEPDGMHTAPANNYGDLPFHFGVITSFAWGENLPPEHPSFAGLRFAYPFLIDFLTAFFRRAGAGWSASFLIENFTLALALVGLIETLARRMTGIALAARLAPLIFLFNGGFGFLNLFRDLRRGGAQTLWHLPDTYTMNAQLADIPLRWGNVFTTLLIPQRSLLFGLPIVAFIITLWWIALGEETEARARRRALVAAGVLAGLLPLMHAHGFFAVGLAAAAMFALFPSRDWIGFFLAAGLLAAPQAIYLSGTPLRSQLFTWHWGWEAGETPFHLFWFANAGVFIALLLVALIARRVVAPRVRRFALPFMLWFIVPNLVLLAPWAWDNIKVLIYWSLAASPLVAAVLARWWSQRSLLARLMAAALLLALTFSGALDVARSLSPVEDALLYGRAELEVADLLRTQTPPRAVIAHAPIHNSVVTLSGRQSLIGYPGHLWTHGIDYSEREAELRMIFRGGEAAERLLARYGVDYVVIGPSEREKLSPDEEFFARFPVVIDAAGYRVYQIN